MNCFRYLDFKSFAEVDRLTIPEYNLLMEAAQLKQIDKMRDIHLQAWLTFAAKATKGKGKNVKPVYSKFERFYNYKEELKKVQQPEENNSKFSGIGKFLKKGE